ncbi:MAG: hypothetical protein FAZ92_01726 [Accumulibacter sp.]|nr:MAG: hypothetical protein FAZ92_01726 [Accumulibacter sp.]
MRDAVRFLSGDGLQQRFEMGGLVERSNDDADLNVAQVDDARIEEQAEARTGALMDEADFVGVHGVDGEHVPVDGNDLFRADFPGHLECFPDGHVAYDAAPTAKEIVLVHREESGVDRAAGDQCVDDLLAG